MRNTADLTGGKPIAVLLQSISGVSAINPLVAFYDIHGGKTEVLFFYFVPDTTRVYKLIFKHAVYTKSWIIVLPTLIFYHIYLNALMIICQVHL
jgi:hypothetical protein